MTLRFRSISGENYDLTILPLCWANRRLIFIMIVIICTGGLLSCYCVTVYQKVIVAGDVWYGHEGDDGVDEAEASIGTKVVQTALICECRTRFDGLHYECVVH